VKLGLIYSLGKKQNQINFQEINVMFLIYLEKSSSFLDYFWFFGDPGKHSFTMTKLLFL